jgi:predicted enzyme related to lactoylglutathione lyase
MPAQMKHIAIITDRYTLMARFYEAVFGLWTFPDRPQVAAIAVSDGHVGLNFNVRAPGRQAGLDHFGFEVEDVEATIARAKKHEGAGFVKRPSNRPFAGTTMNDPVGFVFDLAHADTSKREGVYGAAAEKKRTKRRISHFMMRTLYPAKLADFYRDVFELIEQPRQSNDDPNFYLSDGTVTIVIAPWNIADYQGTGIERPAMDHIGFTVESLETFERELKDLASSNVTLMGPSLTATPERARRHNLLKTCRLGKFHMADPDGVLLDISEAA